MSKVETARQAFDSLKSQGLKATKSSIAKLAKVSRSLLTPDRNGVYKTKEWERLSNDIAAYESSNKPTKTADRYRNKMLELRHARDEAKSKYHAQVEQTATLYAEMLELRQESSKFKSAFENIVKEKDELQQLYGSLVAHYNQPGESDRKILPFAAHIPISPDVELLNITGGQYRWDSLTAKQSHIYAQRKLKRELARLVPKRLYLMIGRPGSGKSSWIKKPPPFSDGRLPICYDATNASRADRWEIMEIAKESSDTAICYVYFDIDVRACIANSRKRKEKTVPEEVIRNMNIDPPTMAEGFDELIVVRKIG